jgi:hypothetical protein
MTEKRVTIQQGSPAISLASFALVQKLTAYLIEAKLLPAQHALDMIAEAARMDEDVMDDLGSEVHAASAYLLEAFGKALAQAHHLKWPK